MDNNGELLAQIGTTDTKRAKVTHGWRGTTAPVPDVTFVEETAPAARGVRVVSPRRRCVSTRGRSRIRSTCAWSFGKTGRPATATATWVRSRCAA